MLEAGYKVVIVDNLFNSSDEVLNRIELICGKRPYFHALDIRKEEEFDKVFEEHPDIDCVIHFAALKVISGSINCQIENLANKLAQSVGESGEIPLEYYRTNVYGTICLLSSMTRHNVSNIVFSSSATVYGDATRFENMIPIPETCPVGPESPYGKTKAMNETIITDHVNAQRNNLKKAGKDGSQWNAALLRYFNPAGAHPSGIMGEDPLGIPYNLLPYLAQVAVGRREKLSVFGDGNITPPPLIRSKVKKSCQTRLLY